MQRNLIIVFNSRTPQQKVGVQLASLFSGAALKICQGSLSSLPQRFSCSSLLVIAPLDLLVLYHDFFGGILC
jgi:hypothetical protein